MLLRSRSLLGLLLGFTLPVAACGGGGSPSDDDDSGSGLLDGDPDDLALDVLEDMEIEPVDEDRVGDDEGFLLVLDRIAIAVEDDATVGEVNDLAAKLDVELVGALADAGILVLDAGEPTGDVGWVNDALDTARSSDGVAVASADGVDQEDVVSKNHPEVSFTWGLAAGTTGAWGLETIRAPYAWDLMRKIERNGDLPRVVVIDSTVRLHPDLAFTDDTATRFFGKDGREVFPTNPHGLAVSGIIGAFFDDKGKVGVFPSHPDPEHPRHLEIKEQLYLGGNSNPKVGSTTYLLQLMSREIGATPDGEKLIFNFSFGTFMPEGTNLEGLRTHQNNTGALMHWFTGNVDRVQGKEWLAFCSTGNDRGRVGGAQAVHNSACGNISATKDDPAGDHYTSVEALSGDGNPAGFSNLGGTLAAPGEEVSVLGFSGEATYYRSSGTSYSTPMTAGAAAVLWALFPDLPATSIRQALIDSARPAQGGSAPQVDLWAAIEHLAAIQPNTDIDMLLSDVDDRTIDGSLRTPLSGTVVDLHPSERGNGCVDIADYRAMRDAILDVRERGWAPFEEEGDELRDQNGDGVLAFGTTETTWSRFDITRDGEVNLDDLAKLRRSYKSCDLVDGEPVAEPLLQDDPGQSVETVDLWIPIEFPGRRHAFETGNGNLVAYEPADIEREITPSGHIIVTASLPTLQLEGFIRATVWDGDNPEDFPLGPSEELLAGKDYVLTWPGTIEPTTRDGWLAFRRQWQGDTLFSAHLIGQDQEFETPLSGFDPPWMMGPNDDIDFFRMASVDGSNGELDMHTGGVRSVVATDGVDSPLRLFGWSDDGAGFITRTRGLGNERLFWADADTQQLVEVGPGIAKPFGDHPTAIGDSVYFVGSDDMLYRARVTPGSELNDVEPEVSAPTALFDLSAYTEAYIAQGVPRPVSLHGDIALTVLEGGIWKLLVVNNLGNRSVIVAEGIDTNALSLLSDSVSWSHDGRYLAYARGGAIWVADGFGETFPADSQSLERTLVHDAPAIAAFAPSGNTLAVQEAQPLGPNGPSYEFHHVFIYRQSEFGLEPSNTLEHFPVCGLASWSFDGTEFAVQRRHASEDDVDGDGNPDFRQDCDVQVYGLSDTDPKWSTVSFTNGAGNFSDDEYLSWGADIPYFAMFPPGLYEEY